MSDDTPEDATEDVTEDAEPDDVTGDATKDTTDAPDSADADPVEPDAAGADPVESDSADADSVDTDAADAPPAGDGWHEDSTYVESQVIMTTVRIVAPFAFTYGLFLTFHGGGSPGGGFQGGAIVGATVLMIAFAFGIEPTRDWLANRTVVGLGSLGVVAFALIGLIPLALGGRFLEHAVFGEDLGIYHGTAYALEAVEIVGIAPIVAGVVVGLFFAIAAGFLGGATGWHPVETTSSAASGSPDEPPSAAVDDGGEQQ